jgi:hypothetical protein
MASGCPVKLAEQVERVDPGSKRGLDARRPRRPLLQNFLSPLVQVPTTPRVLVGIISLLHKL